MSETRWPKVGVAVILRRDNKVLLGKRQGSHGENTWSLPGGHVDPFEDPTQTSLREVQEETGLEIDNIRKGPWVHSIFEQEKKHYITLFMRADLISTDEPQILEPEKCVCWQWFSPSDLPSPLFLPLEELIRNNPSALQGNI